MRFSTIAAVLAVVPAVVFGQVNGTTGTNATTTTHMIMVGANGTLTYSPNNITANVNDTISFVFVAKNHTVTQSTFAAPCTQMFNTTTGTAGISSGFMPIMANQTAFPAWSFQVVDTNPLWFFCLQANHCQQGMVFSINATPQKSFATFQQAAMATNQSIAAPSTNGSMTPPMNGTSTNGTAATTSSVASGSSAASSSTSSSASTPSASKSSSSSLVLSGNAAGLVTLVAFAVGITL